MFAKIIEVDGQQVLFFKDFDLDSDRFILHQMFDFKDALLDLRVYFDGEDKRDAAFDLVDKDHAKNILAGVRNVLDIK